MLALYIFNKKLISIYTYYKIKDNIIVEGSGVKEIYSTTF